MICCKPIIMNLRFIYIYIYIYSNDISFCQNETSRTYKICEITQFVELRMYYILRDRRTKIPVVSYFPM